MATIFGGVIPAYGIPYATIYTYIYEKSAIRLTSVGLAHTRSNNNQRISYEYAISEHTAYAMHCILEKCILRPLALREKISRGENTTRRKCYLTPARRVYGVTIICRASEALETWECPLFRLTMIVVWNARDWQYFRHAALSHQDSCKPAANTHCCPPL